MTVRTINPYTLQELGEYQEDSLEQVQIVISQLRSAQRTWKGNVDDRVEKLIEAKDRFEKASDKVAKLISMEMGKTLAQSQYEIKRSLELWSFICEKGPSLLVPENVRTEARKSYVRFDPLGLALLIEPWNSPLWQVLRAGLPALLAGNSVLLKHSSNVTGTSLLISDLFALDVFKSVIVKGEKIFQIFPMVDVVSFTGSTETGSVIAEHAGREIKNVVLELGGSDPFIVLDDSQIEETVKSAVTSRLRNNGQSCIAAKRFIVHQSVFNRFKSLMEESFAKIRMGDPLSLETQLGPLATAGQHAQVTSQVSELRRRGAVSEFGQEIGGYFVRPTIACPERAYNEEVFGPVAILQKFSTLEEAVELANDTPFGLGASIWGNWEVAEKLAPAIEAGNVFINQTVTSDPRLPFGGIKKSGLGRELSSYGIKEFTNIKTVWVR